MIRRLILVSMYISLVLFCSCELYVQDEYKSYYAIESYLIANDSLSQVRVTKTIPINENPGTDKLAIQDAEVQIRLLNPDSSVSKRYQYKHDGHGRYVAVDGGIVQPNHLYQLYITLNNGDIVKTKTLVPGQFNIVGEPPNNYVYRGKSQIGFTTTPSKYPNRQTYYLFTANALDSSRKNLTPFYKKLVQEQNGWINNYYINSSDINNETTFNVDEQGNIKIKIPWSLIAFYGQNDITINAIDDNLYNYVRSQDGFTEGTTWANGKVQNTRYNISGGIGIFGSMARVTRRIDIERAK